MKGKVVIFGGAGFIGSYLTEELLKREIFRHRSRYQTEPVHGKSGVRLL